MLAIRGAHRSVRRRARHNRVRCRNRKRLFVLRHAKSSWEDPGLDDHERPLAPRGRRAVKVLNQHLREQHIAPDLVICSTSRRTRETLEGVQPGGEISIESELYAASAKDVIERLRHVPEDTGSVMVIGHNPAMQLLVLRLTANGARAPEGSDLAADPAEVPHGRAGHADVRLRLERAVARQRGAVCVRAPEGDRPTALGVRVELRRRSPAARRRGQVGRRACSRASSSSAPCLDSGSLRLPHFGDCTHEGQPDLHGHSPISRAASPTSRSNWS